MCCTIDNLRLKSNEPTKMSLSATGYCIPYTTRVFERTQTDRIFEEPLWATPLNCKEIVRRQEPILDGNSKISVRYQERNCIFFFAWSIRLSSLHLPHIKKIKINLNIHSYRRFWQKHTTCQHEAFLFIMQYICIYICYVYFPPWTVRRPTAQIKPDKTFQIKSVSIHPVPLLNWVIFTTGKRKTY